MTTVLVILVWAYLLGAAMERAGWSARSLHRWVYTVWAIVAALLVRWALPWAGTTDAVAQLSAGLTGLFVLACGFTSYQQFWTLLKQGKLKK